MIQERFKEFKERAWALWSAITKDAGEEDSEYPWRNKIIVFGISIVLALGLWLMVNLSRDYTLNVNMPVSVGNIPSDRALAEDLPDFVTVSVSGEGWQLITVYNNPPPIFVDVTRNEINLYDQVQQQMNATPELTVQKVQPLYLNINLEKNATKKIPVVSNVSVMFNEQYDFLNDPYLEPDSVVITGALSLLENINRWETKPVTLNGVKEDVETAVELKEPDKLLSLVPDEVTFKGEVAQFTEGEARVYVEARNILPARKVNFSPSSITVKYDVPISEYAEVQDLATPFEAYVDYNRILQDSTGFVVPQVEKTADSQYHVRIRSFQPTEVSYFMVIDD